jgi:hypothetical protein
VDDFEKESGKVRTGPFTRERFLESEEKVIKEWI